MTEPLDDDDIRTEVLRRREWRGFAAVARIRDAITQREYLAAQWAATLDSLTWESLATGTSLCELLKKLEGITIR